MNEAKSYIIRILNDQYTLSSDEPQEHINKSSELVNLFIREVLDHNKHMEHKKVAILAALRMASHILQLESQLDVLRKRELAVTDALTSLCTRIPECEQI